jgi:hypothetical protein
VCTLYPNDLLSQQAWMKVHQKRLLTNAEVLEKTRTEADYFERNDERMRYPESRRQHLFVGSGVIEAGCKTVIGSRLKQSGMFWTVRGANSILALRCCHLNGRFEDYWEPRRAA